jgi:hypothetical protein
VTTVRPALCAAAWADLTWMTAVGFQGWVILTDLANTFGVEAPVKG